MATNLLKSLTADVSLSDEQYVKNEKARFIPLSVNPFRQPQTKNHLGESHCGEETERPPEWLELAGDLAWTASFASVTSNTTVTEPISVWNYAVFFALTWHLWATQTTYDIKYYTNDWWHRGLFASQLAIYAILAAVSGSFNIGWEISSDAMHPFTGNNTALTGKAIRENEVLSMKNSLIGVNIVMFVSRMLLFVQYLRVIWYRRQSKQLWSWRFYLPPASIFTAGCIFLGCFIMLQKSDGNKSVAVAQLTLWTLAITIQALAAAFTPEDDKNVLKSKSTLTPRLSTLTVIIMGEGLNGMCGNLRNSINSLGLTPKMVTEALSMLLVLYFVWLLYFDGFRVKAPSHRALEELWLWSHFPLHLSLIMLLEGIKNMFIATNVLGAIELLGDSLVKVVEFGTETGEFPKHPRMEALLLPVKMSWQQEVEDLTKLINEDTDDSYTAAIAQICRWFATGIHNIFLANPEAEFEFSNYISSNDSVISDDFGGDDVLMTQFSVRYGKLMTYSHHWLLAMAGTVLLCMAILNVMQRRPSNRFAWGYSFNRAVIGSILILIGGVTRKSVIPVYWLVPTITLVYSTAALVDWVVLFLSIRSIRKKESSSVAYTKVNEDPGCAVNVRRFSQRFHTQIASMQRDSVNSSSSATDSNTAGRTASTQYDVFDPYAEAGVPYYPSYHDYSQGSGGSFSESPTQTIVQRTPEGATP
ncbi:hypothetical protein M407DRAFT_20506 [Tulasnella calospora MUT 4182]|uniref:Uncharacterized protein n=1 Tax=Tulasnella calospora MUT 4182 TaxID=1051891 RepID=A0A0C3QPZ0_9AGAM|nr:hypothetical protein M407DRAFT_20506 [Tulasnella calospora MUT 4182]